MLESLLVLFTRLKQTEHMVLRYIRLQLIWDV